MIKIENLNKRFRKLHALQDVNVLFEKGQAVSLIGPNGSGKTTLIKSILGLVKPEHGDIFFDGTPVNEDVSYRERIGYMPQIGRYPDNMKIGQIFSMIKNIRGEHAVKDEELFYRFRLDTLLEKSMRSLSGGTRQKVSAALAFLFDPEVLILDEPTAGLDPLATEILKEKIRAEKEKGKLILITSHVLSDLEDLATDVMYMQDGKMIFYHSLEELFELTGEIKLGRAVAAMMKQENKKNEVTYLKIAK